MHVSSWVLQVIANAFANIELLLPTLGLCSVSRSSSHIILYDVSLSDLHHSELSWLKTCCRSGVRGLPYHTNCHTLHCPPPCALWYNALIWRPCRERRAAEYSLIRQQSLFSSAPFQATLHLC